MNLDTEFARKNMVRQQVRCWDVSTPTVLAALENVPREHFVLKQYADLAFADVMLPLGKDEAGRDQKMLIPKLEGRILQELDIQPTDSALVIGTGSGYLTACMAQLARHVTSIDASAGMINRARERLDDCDVNNVDLQVQDMYERPADTQFDVIAITGSMPVYDARIEDWLKPDGRAFVIVGTEPAMEACLIKCSDEGEISYQSLFETVIPPLVNSGTTEQFSF